MASCRMLTCLERLSLVWACWACWVCCVSVRPCCPAALLRRVWGWLLGACSSVEQEALDELSSTEASGQWKIHLQLHSITHTFINGSYTKKTFTRGLCSGQHSSWCYKHLAAKHIFQGCTDSASGLAQIHLIGFHFGNLDDIHDVSKRSLSLV